MIDRDDTIHEGQVDSGPGDMVLTPMYDMYVLYVMYVVRTYAMYILYVMYIVRSILCTFVHDVRCTNV